MNRALIAGIFTFLMVASADIVFAQADAGRTNKAASDYADGEKRYNKILESWMNEDINELIDSWGPPDSQYRMPNGVILFTWVSRIPLLSPPEGGIYMDRDTFSCKTTFSVRENGRIFRWRWEGSICRQSK